MSSKIKFRKKKYWKKTILLNMIFIVSAILADLCFNKSIYVFMYTLYHILWANSFFLQYCLFLCVPRALLVEAFINFFVWKQQDPFEYWLMRLPVRSRKSCTLQQLFLGHLNAHGLIYKFLSTSCMNEYKGASFSWVVGNRCTCINCSLLSNIFKSFSLSFCI